MLIRNQPKFTESDITDERWYLDRRKWLATTFGAAAFTANPVLANTQDTDRLFEQKDVPEFLSAEVEAASKTEYAVDAKTTDPWWAASYNNFYEFGTDKRSPAQNAKHTFRPHPWSVAVDGEVGKPGVYTLEDVLEPHDMEERIYRFRCVETWAMIVPWIGFPLADLLKRFEPKSSAKYVSFETLKDPEQMPYQRQPILDWPYREGLRMDEAMHPLTLMTVGMYGKIIPLQNGAPLRLNVPWKYGFKSIKSIVRITLMEEQPTTTWSQQAPREYGFYANVNPTVAHPRWSQAKERLLGESGAVHDTLMFNGYEEEVASLYEGMDLRKFY